jgi:hypothetical protein
MRQFAELAGDVRDPYPMLAGVRADSPVLEVHYGPGSGRRFPLDPKAPRVPSLFTVTSHELAQQVLTDTVRFSSAGYAMTIGQMRILLTAVLDRLPGLRLDPAAEDPHIHGLLFRSPPNLPVRFSPA